MKKLILLTLVLIGVILLFVYISSHKSSFFQSAFPSAAITSSPTIIPTPSLSQNHIVPLTIKDNKLIEGPSSVKVGQNEMVIFKITSDTDDELELPGYNKHVFLQKGKMVILSFLTTISGNFSYQLINAKKVLGNIVVTR